MYCKDCIREAVKLSLYSGPCILRPITIQPEEYGLKLKMVLKWRDIYIENITVVLLDGQS